MRGWFEPRYDGARMVQVVERSCGAADIAGAQQRGAAAVGPGTCARGLEQPSPKLGTPGTTPNDGRRRATRAKDGARRVAAFVLMHRLYSVENVEGRLGQVSLVGAENV